jgi:hypothetical protein
MPPFQSTNARQIEIMRRLAWNTGERQKEELAGWLVENLAELVPVIQQAVGLEWTASLVSLARQSRFASLLHFQSNCMTVSGWFRQLS